MPAGRLSRERIVLPAALAGVTALAWVYLIIAARTMSTAGMPDTAASGAAMPGMAMSGTAMPGMAMPGMTLPAQWGVTGFALIVAMWWVMMLGMMLPSATPMILLHATIARRQRQSGRQFVPTAVFVAGYLLAWGAFSLAASLLQWRLDQAGLLSLMMQAKGSAIGGALFLLAGVYQCTPFKSACLRHCRSPFAFLLNRWRDGWNGALAMGWQHGLYCLGCCWVLMLVLFSVGVMNLLWVALLTGFVLAEKVLPRGVWVGRSAGLLMLGFGGYLLARAAGCVA